MKARNFKIITYCLLSLFIVSGLYFLNVTEQVEAKSTRASTGATSTIPPEFVMPDLSEPMHQSQPDLTLHLCENYTTPIEDISAWKKEKSDEIKAFYQKLHHDNTERTKLDYISKLSGVNFMRGRMYSINPFERKILPHLADKNAEVMAYDAGVLFSKLLTEDKLDELVLAFSKGDLPLNEYTYYSSKVLPPISHILLKHNTQQGQDAVLQLIALGASPTFIDLVTATELSLPVAFVDRLYTAGEVDATRVYYDLGYYNSLTLVATKALSSDLVAYWLSLNSPASPDPFHLNALDLIEIPKSENQKALYLEIFTSLMNSGVKPNYQPTVNKLLSWLPEDLINKYKSIFSEINDHSMPESWKAFVYMNVFELYKIALRGHLRAEGSDVITNQCFFLIGNKMIRLAVTKKSTTKAIETTTKNSSFELNAKELIKASNIGAVTIDEVIDNLSMRNDLAGKLAIQELLLSQVNNQLDAQKARLQSETSAVQRKALESAFLALKHGDWQGIEKIIAEVEGASDTEKVDMLLILAISSNQDWLIIKGLLAQGANLPENAMILLAQSNNVLLARNLMPYGLNLKLIDSIGNNAFFYSVTFNAKDMIVFLLSQGVELNINAKGLDPLDQALALIKFRPELIQSVELLINGGINISKSHKERTLSYRDFNVAIYEQLVNKFPQLSE